VITQKGRGYVFAENDPLYYHGVPAFRVDHDLPGQDLKASSPAKTFTAAFGGALLEAAGADERIVAVTAAMEDGTGLSAFRRAFPNRFFDVGIAEEHAVTFAAGLAAAGLRPVVAVYSTFIQRGADQIIHDVCLQNLPVVFALDRSGLVGDDGETHQGIFDISLFRSAPGIAILAPAGEEELAQMLRWALSRRGPVMIRYPKAFCPAGEPAFFLPIEEGRGVWIRRTGSGICIMFTGSLYAQAMRAEEIFAKEEISVDLYNLRFLKPLDEAYLAAILDSYEFVIVAEEGMASGGFGEYLSELAARRSCSCKLSVLAVGEKFDALGARDELLRRNGLDGPGISEAVCRASGITAGKAFIKEGRRNFA
jgi:1-deoxy-D-xylulose-5-phosphate synthase